MIVRKDLGVSVSYKTNQQNELGDFQQEMVDDQNS
jgi:hypothetical protein